MVSIIKFTAVFLLVLLPTLIAAKTTTQCKVSVSQILSETSSKYYTYIGTITNVGSLPVSKVTLTSSVNLHSLTGLTESGDSYTYAGALPDAGSSYSFTYTVKKGNAASWSNTLSCTTVSASAPTAAPTQAPTAAATSKATKAPTTAAPTKAPTAAPTKAPTTAAPTAAPTSKATTAPTAAPTSGQSPSGRKCPTGTWWAPAPQTAYQWQLTGTIDQTINVQMYDIDMFDNTVDTIASLHAAGRAVICYFSTQYENWRPDAASFTTAVLGENLDDWVGEKYVDIRSPIVRAIMQSRLDIAASKGCDGVEPDNVDGYEAKTGFPLTAADQIDFNTFIATEAHSRGLSVGLKNDVDQATALQPLFDWALNEQCYEYSECNTLNTFITHGKAVFNTEYSGTAAKICPAMVTSKFTSLLKTLDLTAAIKTQCCTYQTGGCAAVPYKCISSMSSRDVFDFEDNSVIGTIESA